MKRLGSLAQGYESVEEHGLLRESADEPPVGRVRRQRSEVLGAQAGGGSEGAAAGEAGAIAENP